MTAIVGESGCGKSTVVNLLIGARRPGSGSVTVGGERIERISRESFYAHVASVSYNTYLFNDTVRANFELAKRGVAEEAIWAALKKSTSRPLSRKTGGWTR